MGIRRLFIKRGRHPAQRVSWLGSFPVHEPVFLRAFLEQQRHNRGFSFGLKGHRNQIGRPFLEAARIAQSPSKTLDGEVGRFGRAVVA